MDFASPVVGAGGNNSVTNPPGRARVGARDGLFSSFGRNRKRGSDNTSRNGDNVNNRSPNPLLAGNGGGEYDPEPLADSVYRFQRQLGRELKDCEDVLRGMKNLQFRFQLTGRDTNISLDLVSFMYETIWNHFRSIVSALLTTPSGDMFVTFHALDLLSYVFCCSSFLPFLVRDVSASLS